MAENCMDEIKAKRMSSGENQGHKGKEVWKEELG